MQFESRSMMDRMAVQMSMTQYGLAFRSQLGFALDSHELLSEAQQQQGNANSNVENVIVLRGQDDADESKGEGVGQRGRMISGGGCGGKIFSPGGVKGAFASSSRVTSRSPTKNNKPQRRQRPEWNMDAGASFAGPGKRGSSLFDSTLRKDTMRLSELKAVADMQSGRAGHDAQPGVKGKQPQKAWDDDVVGRSNIRERSKAGFGSPSPLPPAPKRRPATRRGVPRLYAVPKRYANVKRTRPLWEPKSRKEPKAGVKIRAVKKCGIHNAAAAAAAAANGIEEAALEDTSVVDDELALLDAQTIASREDGSFQLYHPAPAQQRRQVRKQQQNQQLKLKQQRQHVSQQQTQLKQQRMGEGAGASAIDAKRLQRAVNEAVERETHALMEHVELLVNSRFGSARSRQEPELELDQAHGRTRMVHQQREGSRSLGSADRMLEDLNRLILLENSVKNKWAHLKTGNARSGKSNDTLEIDPLVGASSRSPGHHTASQNRSSARSAIDFARSNHAQNTSHLSLATNFPLIDEKAVTSILENRAEFRRHRASVEATLQGTGMSQHQVVESVADVLFQKYLTEMAEQMLGSCDSVAEALFETI